MGGHKGTGILVWWECVSLCSRVVCTLPGEQALDTHSSWQDLAMVPESLLQPLHLHVVTEGTLERWGKNAKNPVPTYLVVYFISVQRETVCQHLLGVQGFWIIPKLEEARICWNISKTIVSNNVSVLDETCCLWLEHISLWKEQHTLPPAGQMQSQWHRWLFPPGECEPLFSLCHSQQTEREITWTSVVSEDRQLWLFLKA